MQEFLSFSDESGISKSSPCYTIGVLNVPLGDLEYFNKCVKGIYEKSGIQGEIKWEKIRGSAGQVNFCIDLMRFVFSSGYSFHAIAVYKKPYRMWHSDEEKAFFVTYNQLLRQSSASLNANINAVVDKKSTSYTKQDEVMQIITNRMLAKYPTKSVIAGVTMDDSKAHWGLQAVDILTGAVNSSYQLYFDPNAQMQDAKKIAIAKMANMVGWDCLAYDTLPNDSFNIWHFPIETRAKPKTMPVNLNLNVQPITRDEFEFITKKEGAN
jgi:hypothetical protein